MDRQTERWTRPLMALRLKNSNQNNTNNDNSNKNNNNNNNNNNNSSNNRGRDGELILHCVAALTFAGLAFTEYWGIDMVSLDAPT